MKSKKIKDPGVLIYDAVCAAICLVCVILSIVGLFTETGETELLRHKYNLGESLGPSHLSLRLRLSEENFSTSRESLKSSSCS